MNDSPASSQAEDITPYCWMPFAKARDDDRHLGECLPKFMPGLVLVALNISVRLHINTSDRDNDDGVLPLIGTVFNKFPINR